MDDPEGEIQVDVERPRKKKKPRKNVLPPTIAEVSATMSEMEEDFEDMIPLIQRTRAARVVAGERAVRRATPPPMTEENLIEVEESTEVEVHEEQHLEKEPGNDEFQVEKNDFMPGGTTMEGDKIIDSIFPPLPKGPLGMPTLPSPTPQEELEEGKIPLQME